MKIYQIPNGQNTQISCYNASWIVDLFLPDLSSKNIDLPKIVEKEKKKISVRAKSVNTDDIFVLWYWVFFTLFVGQMQKQFRPSANNEDEDEMKDALFPPSFVR